MCSPDTGWVGTPYRLSDTISAVVHSSACSSALFWNRHVAGFRVACSSLAENSRSSLVTLQEAAIGVTRPEGRREAGNRVEGVSVGQPAGKDVSRPAHEEAGQVVFVNTPCGSCCLPSYYC